MPRYEYNVVYRVQDDATTTNKRTTFFQKKPTALVRVLWKWQREGEAFEGKFYRVIDWRIRFLARITVATTAYEYILRRFRNSIATG